MRTRMLTFLAILILGAVICLPGMARADIHINLFFDDLDVGALPGNYGGFLWTGDWTVVDLGGSQAVSSSSGASISRSTLFNLEGAAHEGAAFGKFAADGTTYLTITGYRHDMQIGTPVSVNNLTTGLVFAPMNFSDIDKLRFASDGVFVMDNFLDMARVPIPGALVLLGAGLVRLKAYGGRRQS